jgi:hypothetical protein
MLRGVFKRPFLADIITLTCGADERQASHSCGLGAAGTSIRKKAMRDDISKTSATPKRIADETVALQAHGFDTGSTSLSGQWQRRQPIDFAGLPW